MNAQLLAESHDVFRRKARTFWWASRLLPRTVRDDAATVYAFCRMVDDMGDEADDPSVAELALQALSNEVAGRQHPRPIVAELRAAAARLGLPMEAAAELIAGVRSDLGVVRMVDDAELVRYCYRVASTVGLMMCGVLGVHCREALPHAIDLGIAMQLTNICRDVAEDAERGRVYLPAARLRAAGIDPEEVVRGTADPERMAIVVRSVLALADRYYRSADGGMRDIPWRFRPAILVASRTYRAIGVKLRGRPPGTSGRAVVPWPEKLAWSATAVAASLRPAILGITPRWAHDRALHQALRGLPGANA
ncbi:MAG TPA: phytoene/squalene synthase family protein [Longimicrobium sp.]